MYLDRNEMPFAIKEMRSDSKKLQVFLGNYLGMVKTFYCLRRILLLNSKYVLEVWKCLSILQCPVVDFCFYKNLFLTTFIVLIMKLRICYYYLILLFIFINISIKGSTKLLMHMLIDGSSLILGLSSCNLFLQSYLFFTTVKMKDESEPCSAFISLI